MSGLIFHEYNGIEIPQRPDGYINVSKMCQAGGKLWSNFWQLKSTKDYLEALEAALGIPRAELVISQTAYGSQGTWAHQRIASRLAQWISPEFAVIVDGWVIDIKEGRNPLESAQPEPTQPQLPPLPSQREQLETANLALNLLDRLGGADERTEMMFRDYIVNVTLKGTGSTVLLAPAEFFEITISERSVQLGYRPTSTQLSSIGKVMARLYRERYGEEPPTRRQLVNGAPRDVKSYTTKDLDLMDEAIRRVMEQA